MATAEHLKRIIAYPAMLGAFMAAGYFSELANTEAEAADNTPTASRQSDELVFSSNRSGNYQIYLKNLATKKLVNLSNDKSNDMNAQPSPDGKELVFYSDRSGTNQIYALSIANPDEVKALTHDGANDYDPTFTTDGRHILYKSDLKGEKGLGDIWEMNADGNKPHDLTVSRPGSEDWKPEPISNNTLLFTSSKGSAGANPSANELYSLNTKTGVTQRLTDNKVPDWFPSYDPTNKEVAFISKANSAGSDAIYTMNQDGKHRTKITKLAGDSDDPSWTTDGRNITFVNNVAGHYRIYSMDKSGNSVRLLDKYKTGDDLSPVIIP